MQPSTQVHRQVGHSANNRDGASSTPSGDVDNNSEPQTDACFLLLSTLSLFVVVVAAVVVVIVVKLIFVPRRRFIVACISSVSHSVLFLEGYIYLLRYLHCVVSVRRCTLTLPKMHEQP